MVWMETQIILGQSEHHGKLWLALNKKLKVMVHEEEDKHMSLQGHFQPSKPRFEKLSQ